MVWRFQMRERRRSRYVAVLLSLLFLLGPGLAAAEPQPDHIAGDFGAIDAYVTAQLRDNHVPGAALAIVRGDQIVHLRGFGTARAGWRGGDARDALRHRLDEQVDHRAGADAASGVKAGSA